jgi:hypothetical protein
LKSKVSSKQRHYETLLDEINRENKVNLASYIKRIENLNHRNLEIVSEYTDLEKECSLLENKLEEVKSVYKIESEDLRSQLDHQMAENARLAKLKSELELAKKQEVTRLVHQVNHYESKQEDVEDKQIEVDELKKLILEK